VIELNDAKTLIRPVANKPFYKGEPGVVLRFIAKPGQGKEMFDITSGA